MKSRVKLKVLILTIISLLLLNRGTLPQDKPKGMEELNLFGGEYKTIRAVIVGVSEYSNSLIPKLNYAHTDAISFYNFLRSSAGGSVDSSNIKLLLNKDAIANQIWSALDWIVAESQEEDLAIFYFSGHGDLEKKIIGNIGFLLAYDAPVASYRAVGTIDLIYLQLYLKTLAIERKSRVILISDACKSGRLAGGIEGVTNTTSALLENWGDIVKILSSQPGELSYEDKRWGNGSGVFTYYLLRGLKGLADLNSDKQVTLKELDIFLSQKIPFDTEYRQNPTVVGTATTLLTQVDSLTLASLLDEDLSKPTGGELLAMKGNEQTSPSLDTTTSGLLKKFQFCLDNGQLIYPSDDNENALDIYYGLKDREDLSATVSSMKYSLIAALQNNTQKLISNYLEGKVEEEEPVDINVAYEELDKAYWLIDTTYILYDQIKAKHYFMESLFYSTNEFDKRIELLQECINIQPDASYAYCELGRAYHEAKSYDNAIVNYNKAIELSPRWKYPYYNTGIVYADLKQNEKSIEYTNKALEIDPNYPNAYHNLGFVYSNMGDQTKAIEYYNKAINVDSNYVVAYGNLGLIYDGIGEDSLALGYYNQAIEIDPYYKLAYYNLGVVHYNSEQMDDAMENFQKAIEIDPKYTDAYHYLALICDSNGEDQKAIEYYNKTVEIDPNYKLGYYNLAMIYSDMGETEIAIDHYKKIIEIDPYYTDAYNNLGLIYYSNGDGPKAIEYYSKAVEIDPNYKLGYYNLGILYYDSKQMDQSIENFKKATEIDPNYTDAYNYLGVCYYYKGDLNKAIDYYLKTTDVDPNYKLAYYNLGLVYTDLGETENALQNFNQTIKLDSNYITAYDQAGVLYYQSKDYNSAVSMYTKHIEFYPEDYYGYQMRGLNYLYDGNYERSLLDFQKVIELNPEDAGGYYNLACYYSVTNKTDESLANLEKAFQLGYSDFANVDVDQDLNNIRSLPGYAKLLEKYRK